MRKRGRIKHTSRGRTLDGEVSSGSSRRVGGAARALEARLALVHAAVVHHRRLDRQASPVHGQQVLDAVILNQLST